jgi:hypothetical protein
MTRTWYLAYTAAMLAVVLLAGAVNGRTPLDMARAGLQQAIGIGLRMSAAVGG